MRNYILSFGVIFGAIAFFFAPQSAGIARVQTMPTPTIFQKVLQANDGPSFFPLAPCPSCTNPSEAVLEPGKEGKSYEESKKQPKEALPDEEEEGEEEPEIDDPCETEGASLAHDRKKGGKNSKHKNEKGAIGEGTEEIFRLLIELISKLIELLGGGQINLPQPTDPGTTNPTPCPPLAQPTTVPVDPPQTQPSAAQPSVTQPSGAPSTIPQPSGSTAGACVAPPGMTALLDQDLSDSQLPWKRNGAAKVVINFSTEGVPADWVTEMQKGAAAWNRSACLDVRLVSTCQGNTNCIPVVVGDGGGADGNFNSVESGGFTTGGDIELLSTLTGGERTNVTIHEMGHAVGLRHRLTERVLMNGDTYPDVFDPDETDFQNLLFLYGSQQ